ncbi:hypothetical protein MIMGU_mgv1a021163mg [Erythranthe guttata]|uniref:Uncharacterized protein n=1 Tax=Erythranthe guttata TaxID=4155 RepID=A0A022Q068_ERYGU|nr:hypothetical protein MIMGU_mgv1a021163mg [Erythranthe guttata]
MQRLTTSEFLRANIPKSGASPQESFFAQIFQSRAPHHKRASSCKYSKVGRLTISELLRANIPKSGASPQASFFVQIFQSWAPHHKRASSCKYSKVGRLTTSELLRANIPKLGASPQASFFVQIFQSRAPYHKRVSSCKYSKVGRLTTSEFLLLNKQKDKVLVDNDFADVLLSFLTLPLGTVVIELDNIGVGATRNVTFGFSQIMDFLKGALLSSTPLSDAVLKKERMITLPKHNPCTALNRTLYNFKKLNLTCHVNAAGPKMYNIADDLTVTPFSTASTISILKGLKIPFSDIVELPVEIRLQEALSILRASLITTYALTDGLMINSMLKKKRKRRWDE